MSLVEPYLAPTASWPFRDTPLVAPSVRRPTYKGTVYLSGPITGLSYTEARYGWRQEVIDRLELGIKALSPMRHEGHLAEVKEIDGNPEKQSDHFFSGSKVIVAKDKLDIIRSDIMLVNLLGAQRVSIGTVMEIGIAYALGKTIVTVMEADGSNPHEHAFVTVPSDLRLDNLQDAIYAINSLLSEGV